MFPYLPFTLYPSPTPLIRADALVRRRGGPILVDRAFRARIRADAAGMVAVALVPASWAPSCGIFWTPRANSSHRLACVVGYGGICLVRRAHLRHLGAGPAGVTGQDRALRMLDLCAPAAAIGYGIGRIGCFLSGDGCYGMEIRPVHFLGLPSTPGEWPSPMGSTRLCSRLSHTAL